MALPPGPPDDDRNVCPRCGTPSEPGQEYCLECGLRLPARGVVAGLSAAWRRRLPYYPGDWIWPVLVGLVVAALAAAVVIAVAGEGSGRTTLVATEPPVTGPTAPPPPPPPPPPTGPTSPPKPPPRPRVLTWPRNTNGFTVILESIPTSAGRRLAVQKAEAGLKAGLNDVGVLDSSRYASLHPGYFVVFSGVFHSNAEAVRALADAQARGYEAAYARPITS